MFRRQLRMGWFCIKLDSLSKVFAAELPSNVNLFIRLKFHKSVLALRQPSN